MEKYIHGTGALPFTVVAATADEGAFLVTAGVFSDWTVFVTAAVDGTDAEGRPCGFCSVITSSLNRVAVS